MQRNQDYWSRTVFFTVKRRHNVCFFLSLIETRLKSMFSLYLNSTVNDTWSQFSRLHCTWRGQQFKLAPLEARESGHKLFIFTHTNTPLLSLRTVIEHLILVPVALWMSATKCFVIASLFIRTTMTENRLKMQLLLLVSLAGYLSTDLEFKNWFEADDMALWGIFQS